MKIVRESLNSIPTWEELVSSAPKEIQDILKKCEVTPQSREWHPEAPNAEVPHNVLAHIRIVFDRARESGDINLALAAFFHDLGKADTTALNAKGTWSAHGHERVSRKLAQKYSGWIEEMGGDPEEVAEIVGQHMRIQQFPNMRSSKKEEMRQNRYFNKIQQFTKFDDMQNLTDDELNRYK